MGIASIGGALGGKLPDAAQEAVGQLGNDIRPVMESLTDTLGPALEGLKEQLVPLAEGITEMLGDGPAVDAEQSSEEPFEVQLAPEPTEGVPTGSEAELLQTQKLQQLMNEMNEMVQNVQDSMRGTTESVIDSLNADADLDSEVVGAESDTSDDTNTAYDHHATESA